MTIVYQTASVNRESSVWLMFIRRLQLCFSCVCQLFGSTFLVLHGAHTITLSKQLVEVGTIIFPLNLLTFPTHFNFSSHFLTFPL